MIDIKELGELIDYEYKPEKPCDYKLADMWCYCTPNNLEKLQLLGYSISPDKLPKPYTVVLIVDSRELHVKYDLNFYNHPVVVAGIKERYEEVKDFFLK